MSIWSPLQFVKEGRKRGYKDDYLLHLSEYGRRLSDANLPVIFTLPHLCALAGVSFPLIQSCVSRTHDPYKSFAISKRSGGYRQIVVPEPELMHLQRWINRFILENVQVHPCASAYMSGADIKKNASKHIGAGWLIKMDVLRFFESISEIQVYYVFRSLGYAKLLSFQMARLCTRVTKKADMHNRSRWVNKCHHFQIPEYSDPRVGHLPQGAPTSPALSNLVCRQLDEEIYNLCSVSGCSFSRYADDFAFSFLDLDRHKAASFINDVNKVLQKYGFRKNARKTKILPPGAKKIVTGLILGKTGPHLQRETKEYIRQSLYYVHKHGVVDHCKKRGFFSIVGFYNHLRGLVNFAAYIEPDFGKKINADFKAIEWPDLIANLSA